MRKPSRLPVSQPGRAEPAGHIWSTMTMHCREAFPTLALVPGLQLRGPGLQAPAVATLALGFDQI